MMEIVVIKCPLFKCVFDEHFDVDIIENADFQVCMICKHAIKEA